MSSPIVTQVIDEMNTLADDLQQQVLTLSSNLYHHPKATPPTSPS